jgi:hypothetical protein
MLRELQGADGDQDPQRAHRRALHSQVRAAIDLLRQRKLEDSLAMLRAVLREDPDNVRAQEAVQQVRRAWLRRTAPPVPRPVEPAAAPPATLPVAAVPAPAPPPRATPATAAAAALAAAPVLHPVAPLPSQRPPIAAEAPRPATASLPRPVERPVATTRPLRPLSEPVDMRPLPPRRRSRPAPVLLAAGMAAAVIMVAALARVRAPASPKAVSPEPVVAAEAAAATPATPAPEPPGPLTGLEDGLRQAIEETLAAYAQALEMQDDAALARTRPDLAARQRSVLLAPFKGALNVAVDLRVVDVAARPEDALVTVLRTDVIVDGRGGARAPVEEALRFVRRGGAWTLGGTRP